MKDTADSLKGQDLVSIAKYYRDVLDFSVIPLTLGEKTPLRSFKWKEFCERKMSDEEIEAYFGRGGVNIGIICGQISNLLVIDVDDASLLSKVEEIEEFKKTLKVKTARGKHYYFKLSFPVRTQKFDKIDLKGEHSYVVAPPSVVNNHRYEFDGESEIVYLSEKKLKEIIFQLFKKEFSENSEKEFKKEFSENSEKEPPLEEKTPPEKKTVERKEEIFKLLDGYYERGMRQNFVLYLSGFLKKQGYSLQEAFELVESLCDYFADEEKKSRLNAVIYTYRKDKVKGVSGLSELLSEELLQKLVTLLTQRERTQRERRVNEFIVIDDIVYQNQKGHKVVGPALRLIGIVKDSDDNVGYECLFRNKIFILKDIEDFATIKAKTGLPVVREQAFKEYLLYETKRDLPQKRILRRFGWDEELREFYHIFSQEEAIWENVFTREFYLAQEFFDPEGQLRLVEQALDEARGLGFLFVFSLSSVVLDFFRLSPSVCVVEGLSSVGKTFCSTLACNLFYPSPFISFTSDTTKTAFELILSSFKNITLLFDELALSSVDTESLVFAAAAGRGRARGTKNLTVKINDLKSNVILTTEISEKFKRTGAFRRFVRLVALRREDLTQIDFSEDKLHLLWGGGLKLVEFMQNNRERLYEIYNSERKFINENKLNSLYNIAMLLLTSLHIFELFFCKKFDKMRLFIVNVLREQQEEFLSKTDIIEKFISDFTEFVTKYSDNFSLLPRQAWGRIDYKRKIIYILPSVFNDFLREYSFSKEIIKLLHENNLLVKKEKDRYTVKTVIGKLTVNAYAIRVELPHLGDEEDKDDDDDDDDKEIEEISELTPEQLDVIQKYW